MVELKLYVLQKNYFWRTYHLRCYCIGSLLEGSISIQNNLESLVLLFLDFQCWNPNFNWLKTLKFVFRFSPGETIVEIAILELGNNSYSILWFFPNLQF
jgi:hypothetical protein